MIFHRALLRELLVAMLTALSVLLAITVTTLTIRFLGEAASGALATEAVAAFLGFSVLNYLPVLASLSLFIAVLVTLTRSYRDSEMVAWFSSGLSITAWIRPVLYFAAPVVVLIATLSLVLSPWALNKRAEFKRQIDSRDELAAVAPGVFKESKQADRVYFVESLAGDMGRVGNIFMQSLQHQKLGIMVAQQGYQSDAPNGDRFLVLLKGRRYEGMAGSPEYKIMQFEHYAVRIEPFEAKMAAPSPNSLSIFDLLRERTPPYMAELHWRLGLPLSALLLAMLAIPLSFVNPRAGRSLNLILALLIYMIYSNFMSIAQAWVAQERLSPAIGLWPVHAGVVLVLAYFFHHRMSLPPRILFRRK